MNEQSQTNRTAWSYRAYEFWSRACGEPRELKREGMEHVPGEFTIVAHKR